MSECQGTPCLKQAQSDWVLVYELSSYGFESHCCHTDLHFDGHKLAIEIDENGHFDKNIDYVIKRQKAVE